VSPQRALFELLRPPFDGIAAWNRPREKPLFIVGHGRSGTTWVGRTFSRHPLVLYYNEPCHFGHESKDGLYSNFMTYVRTNEDAGLFKRHLDTAMSGRLLWKSAEWARQRGKVLRRLSGPYRIVIKEVASLMSLEWVRRQYAPEFLVLYRHPCSIALSEVERGIDGAYSRDKLLGLTALFADHLHPYEAVIRKARRPYELFGAIYGARNRILANFVERHGIDAVFLYENLCTSPSDRFRELFERYGLDLPADVASYIAKHTTTEEPGEYNTTKDSLAHMEKWKRILTQEEAFQVRDFVLPFGLPYYDDPADYLLT
jgi:hypothetical protein